nr:hypothetical protein [Tanacetum cinerariifolium]
MLQSGIGVKQLSADDSDFWPLSMIEQFVQPVTAQHRNVVVHQYQIIPACFGRGPVVHGREIEGERVAKHAYFLPSDRFHVGQPFNGFRGFAVVIDDQDFIVRVFGFFQDRFNAALQHGQLVFGRYDDRDHRLPEVTVLHVIVTGRRLDDICMMIITGKQVASEGLHLMAVLFERWCTARQQGFVDVANSADAVVLNHAQDQIELQGVAVLCI